MLRGSVLLTKELVQGLALAAGARGGSLPEQEGPGLEVGVMGALSVNKFGR